ncbi:CXXC-type zinc finger protein 1-like isoform X2 [Drosophila albomicans]|uniref:CXXC-type zinc finger protein 1 n=1 Tax=Drosophila albomicans TaxID=7291 RepID=A0A9C6SRQ6_DROAB|nr:CXXC-type zinc finger protein 1-like isoform X2 [Drosophila albomicans]
MADKRKYKRSKEEIAREFDLPERKSKIATILKQDDQAYCICRTSDCSRFMIGCDGCEEWYHGDCIGITEKEAKHIKQYYCRKCKKENPELQTIFRLVATERAAATAAAVTATATAANSSGGSNNIHNSGNLEVGAQIGGNGATLPPHSAGNQQPAGGVARKNNNSNNNGNNSGSNNASGREPKAGRRCGTCEGCRRPNCNQCDACRTRVGHKPRCIYRNCVMQANATTTATTTTTTTTTTTGRKRSEKANHQQQQQQQFQQQQRKTKAMRAASPEIFVHPELEGIRQCHGPSCRFQARPQSAAATSPGMESNALPCHRRESRPTGGHTAKAIDGPICARRAREARRGVEYGGGAGETQFDRYTAAAG